jgi:hypothetical protein
MTVVNWGLSQNGQIRLWSDPTGQAWTTAMLILQHLRFPGSPRPPL